MGVLDEAFKGSNGLANTLIDALGGEMTVETVIGETYIEETDKTVQEVSRQILPVVIEARPEAANGSSVPDGEEGGLIGNTTSYQATISAANLDVEPIPLKTYVRDKRSRYQVISVEPNFVGNIPITYRLQMRKL